MKYIKLSIFALLFSLAFSASAVTIYTSSAASVQNINSLKFVEVNGYDFSTPNYGTLLLRNGGLWDGNAFGVPTELTITKNDNSSFFIKNISLTTSAAFSCGGNFCGTDLIQITGISNGKLFGESFKTSGYANANELITLTDPRWQNITKLSLNTVDSFVLNSIEIAAVPLPSMVWLFLAGVLSILGKRKYF
jgi:hypothetical protein